MSIHVYGVIATPPGIAANNRGENEGNISTLQKILWRGQVHTTVSAEAIRWAIRYYWQSEGIDTNRFWDEVKEDYIWNDQKWLAWSNESELDVETFIDDDVMGFMLAEAAGSEGNDTIDNLKKERQKLNAEYKKLDSQGKKTEHGKEMEKRIKELKKMLDSMSKGTCDKRRGVLEVARAISTTPYAGDITFNAKGGEKNRTSLYGTEVHATRYQYGFALTPERLRVKERALNVIDAITNLNTVAGNHSRFLFDFSPESIILRLTDDPAPRFLYPIEESEDGIITVPKLIKRVKAGDILPEELYIGGEIAELLGKEESLQGAVIEDGIKNTVKKFKDALDVKFGEVVK